MLRPLIFFEELTASRSRKIAVATLNNPASLNALTLSMIELLQGQLDRWRQDESIACVFVHGAGERAFCAGGDVVSLYSHAAGYGEQLSSDKGQQYFAAEYRLDYSIHRYPKPIVVWGAGVVMGGGTGLLVGASHRVVTETTRLAMPECTIGLYPDVAAGWFLNRLPGACGRFLALTGATINAMDSKYLGLADYCIGNDQKNVLPELLQAVEWSTDTVANGHQVTDVLLKMDSTPNNIFSAGSIVSCQPWIDQHFTGSLQEVLMSLSSYSGSDKLLRQAAGAVGNSCPASLKLTDEYLRRSAGMSLKEVFCLDLLVSANCLKQGHFKEGVRARLIDKDNQPCWQPASIDDVSTEYIQQFFQVR